jgi:hypothetical protein
MPELDLVVIPGHLDKLATTQGQASSMAGSAATAASNIKTEVWVTHGVVCGASNVAFTNAEAARRAAGEAMKTVSTGLAVKLRAADDAYQSTDTQAGENIDKQLLPAESRSDPLPNVWALSF